MNYKTEIIILFGVIATLSGCDASSQYPELIPDGSDIFTRVSLPGGKGFEYAHIRVLKQRMTPEQIKLEWHYWQSDTQTYQSNEKKPITRVYTPPQSINISLATLHWSGNKSGFGWFGTTPLVNGNIQEYATYMCVSAADDGKQLISRFAECEFSASW